MNLYCSTVFKKLWINHVKYCSMILTHSMAGRLLSIYMGDDADTATLSTPFFIALNQNEYPNIPCKQTDMVTQTFLLKPQQNFGADECQNPLSMMK